MKIYTKTGDAGDTGLLGGTRVSKSDLRVRAYGDVDELNSVLGLVRTQSGAERLDEAIAEVQHELLDLGAELATAAGKEERVEVPWIQDDQIVRLESWIDAAEQELAPLTSFILPGGVAGAAALHLARTVCRRAERSVVALAREQTLRDVPVRYLNRLSDLLFMWARLANLHAGVPDVTWQGRHRK